MSGVFLYKHEAGINPQQLAKLRRHGFIPIGVRYIDDVALLPEPVSLPQASVGLITRAACRAISQSTFAEQKFGEYLAKAILNSPSTKE